MADAGSTDKWVALLRGVNVGGGNKVPMAELRALATGLGWSDVRSYIASGNLVFRAAGSAEALSRDLQAAMARDMGGDVPVLVLPGDAVRKALAECPYAPEKGNLCHVLFLWSDAGFDRNAYERWKAPDDALTVAGRVGWLHTPRGFSATRLSDQLDKVVTGTAITARNLNTLRRLVEMLD